MTERKELEKRNSEGKGMRGVETLLYCTLEPLLISMMRNHNICSALVLTYICPKSLCRSEDGRRR